MREIKTRFLLFVKDYLKLGSPINLKIDHTFRVMKLCRQIAKSLNLSHDDIELAELCGLLHDIGRFEQFKISNCYSDTDECNHGEIGYDLLKSNDFIKEFSKNREDDSVILNTVLYHNTYSVPDTLSDREKLFCNIVRDADKLDILYLYIIHDIEIKLDDSNFSDKIYKSLVNCELIKRSDKNTKADVLSVSLGFVFDFNYRYSFVLLKKNDYYNKEIDYYYNKTSNDTLRKQLLEVKNVINNYIERKISNVR